MLEEIILGIILEQDLAGYNIKQIIENSFGVYYKASYGSLYPALKRLASKGLVTTYEQSQGGRKKIFYHITEGGKLQFMKWLTTPMNILDGTNPNLTKIYFFNHLPSDIREQQLLIYENNCKIYLQELKELEKQFEEVKDVDKFYYKLSILYFGISMTKKTIEWCRYIREKKTLQNFD